MTILILSTCEIEGGTIHNRLESIGVKSNCVYDTVEFSIAATTLDIDLIIIDLELSAHEFFMPADPVDNVFNFIASAKKALPRTPIVGLATFSEANRGGAAYMSGVNAFYLAPLAEHNLIDMLNRFDIDHKNVKARRLTL